MTQPTFPTLVTSAKRATEAILRFGQEVDASPDLASRLAYARAWYAVRENGEWHLGPSKFIGYKALSAEAYIQRSQDLDGRRTEAQLQRWFTELSPRSPDYEAVTSALSTFLARFGKAPSKKMRVSVPNDNLLASDQCEAALVDLLVAVAERLTPRRLKLLRKRLKGVAVA